MKTGNRDHLLRTRRMRRHRRRFDGRGRQEGGLDGVEGRAVRARAARRSGSQGRTARRSRRSSARLSSSTGRSRSTQRWPMTTGTRAYIYVALRTVYGRALVRVRGGLWIDAADCSGSGPAAAGSRFTSFRCSVTSESLEIPSAQLTDDGKTPVEGEASEPRADRGRCSTCASPARRASRTGSSNRRSGEPDSSAGSRAEHACSTSAFAEAEQLGRRGVVRPPAVLKQAVKPRFSGACDNRGHVEVDRRRKR